MNDVSARHATAQLFKKLAAIVRRSVVLALMLKPAFSQVIPGDYLVVLQKGQDPATVAESHGLERRHTYSHALNGFAASIPPARLAVLQRDPRVALVEPDQVASITAQTIPAGISRIGATHSMIAKINGTDERVNVDIAILDTGIDLKHPDLNVVNAVTFVPKDSGTRGADGNGHGTHVAGIAAALDNDIGVVGVAPGARLWAVRVLDDTGYGAWSTVIKGIDYVTQNAATIGVANMSLGDIGTCDTLRLAISNSVAKGVVYVVAAGNNAQDVYGSDGVFNTPDDFIPAAYPEVITVSAMCDYNGVSGGSGGYNAFNGWDDSFAFYSNFGRKIELAAPGASVFSTIPVSMGGYGYKFGTSMAAPHVTGAVALYIAKHGRANDAAGVELIRQALIAAGEPQSAWGPANTADPDGTPEPLVNVSDIPEVAFTTPRAGASLSGTVTVTVSATGSVAVTNVQWYIGGALMGSSRATSSSFLWDTTGRTNGSYTLQARAYDAANNVGTNILTVAVQNQVPNVSAPSVTAAARCGPGSVMLGATGNGGTLKWYSDPGLTTPVGTGASFTTPSLSVTATFYVTETSAEGLASAAVPVTATINAIPAAPGVTPAARFADGTVTLGTTGSGGTLKWYSDPGLTTQVGTGASFTTPPLSETTTFYVTETSAAGCVSTAAPVTATINAIPIAPLVRITTLPSDGATLSGTQVLICWPATTTGYTLYSSLTQPTVAWTSEGTGTLSAGQYWVTNMLSGSSKFYRLQK